MNYVRLWVYLEVRFITISSEEPIRATMKQNMLSLR